MARKATIRCCAATALFVLLGCASSGDISSGGHGQARVAELTSIAVRRGSTIQHQALRDGLITRTEYDQAMAGMMKCLRAAGLTVSGPYPDRTGFLLDYDASVEGMAEAAVTRLSDACEQSYLDLVTEAYIETHFVEFANAEATANKRLIRCMLDMKASVGDISERSPDVLSDLRKADITAFNACFS
ncbi:hypothetical protein ACFLIM_49850 [Nonomuraea sp. M3C6]|uniref:Lipoprotein n=1 Tax=Nonomuraea marmarensis TaxID=3351344 RepID=A0ABW7AW72_9ACTN